MSDLPVITDLVRPEATVPATHARIIPDKYMLAQLPVLDLAKEKDRQEESLAAVPGLAALGDDVEIPAGEVERIGRAKFMNSVIDLCANDTTNSDGELTGETRYTVQNLQTSLISEITAATYDPTGETTPLQIYSADGKQLLTIDSQKVGANVLAGLRNKVVGIFADPFTKLADKDAAQPEQPLQLSPREAQQVELLFKEVMYKYAVDLHNSIDEAKLGNFETMVRDVMGKAEGKPRRNIAVTLNGDINAGKDTSLEQLSLTGVALGTEGTLGRGKGYEHWEYVSNSFDGPRSLNRLYPDRLARLMMSVAILEERQRLDDAGLQDKPVVIVGFPRTESQANFFKGFDGEEMAGIKSIDIRIGQEESILRQIGRMAVHEARRGKIREDDINALDLSDEAKQTGTVSKAVDAIKYIANKAKQENWTDDDIRRVTREKFGPAIKAGAIVFGKNARYGYYRKNATSANDNMGKIGVPTHAISGEGKSPADVAQEIAAILN